MFALCKHKKTDEYHVFETVMNSDKCKLSNCGAVETKDITNCVAVCTSAKEIQTKAPKIGDTACVNCMKIIYKTED